MRSDAEMKELILSVAESDDRIRAVILNGSRANPNVEPDDLQDWDIVYYVTNVEPFRNNAAWVERFGDILIMQMPDVMDGIQRPYAFTYLMQFRDGNRIDLQVRSISYLEKPLDSLSVLLLDKDGNVPPLPKPSELDYLPKPPTPHGFNCCVNEFRWVCPYVTKGLWRGEILYAKHHLDCILRPQLMKMLFWKVGLDTDFKVNPGKNGKFLRKHLSPEIWDTLMSTFSGSDYNDTWEALLNMCRLFEETAESVSKKMNFPLEGTDSEAILRAIEESTNRE